MKDTKSPDSTPSQNIQINEIMSSVLKNTKLLLILVPVGIVLVGLLLWGLWWAKTNFLDGTKTDVREFTSINSNIPYEIRVIKSDKNRVEVNNNENYNADKIDFEIIDSELKLKSIPKLAVASRGAPDVVIYAKNLSKIVSNSKGNIIVDTIISNNIDLESKDKGNITVSYIESKTLSATVRDSGDVKVESGKTDSIVANIVNSGGKIDLSGVESPTAKTKDIGTGTIKLDPNTVDESKSKDKSRK
jgi:Putative auto-transporter adhesin, head GIN domain